MEPSAVAGAPLVSIIVPCYVTNSQQAMLLEETLASVATQTVDDYELIVVDDGSPKRTAGIVSLPDIAVNVRQDNAGSAVARNTGIAHSRGQYLVFLDADDLLLPVALEAGLDAFAAHPESGFVVGPREEMTFEGTPVTWQVPVPPAQTQLYNALLAFEWYIIPPSSAMFRRDVVNAIGGFRDPWGADDLDFYLRAARQFSAWCYQSPAVTRYRRYSASSSRDGERMLRSVRTVYERQRPTVVGDPEAEAAFERGLRQLTGIFLDCIVENIVDRLRAGDRQRAVRSARLLADESPEKWAALVGAGRGVESLAPDVTHGDAPRRGADGPGASLGRHSGTTLAPD
jgi:GT2 family glycosyltransferase